MWAVGLYKPYVLFQLCFCYTINVKQKVYFMEVRAMDYECLMCGEIFDGEENDYICPECGADGADVVLVEPMIDLFED